MAGHSFLDSAVIDRLAQITLESRRAMIGSVAGRHRSPLRGSSLEFSQYRKYEAGDDMRRLDWRVWGRTDRAYVKEFEADTNLRMCFVVDASGSMNYRGANAARSKFEIAKSIAGTLAWVAVRQGDAVGLTGTLGQDARQQPAGVSLADDIPVRRGPRHLRAVLDRLEGMRAGGDGDLAEQLHRTAERVPRRGLVVILSDLFTDMERLREGFQHLGHRKHDVVVFHLIDESEVDLDFGQPIRFVDLEGGQAILSDPVRIRDNYRALVAQYFAEIQELVRSTNVDYRRLDLQCNLADELAEFLNRRIGRGGGANRR